MKKLGTARLQIPFALLTRILRGEAVVLGDEPLPRDLRIHFAAGDNHGAGYIELLASSREWEPGEPPTLVATAHRKTRISSHRRRHAVGGAPTPRRSDSRAIAGTTPARPRSVPRTTAAPEERAETALPKSRKERRARGPATRAADSVAFSELACGSR